MFDVQYLEGERVVYGIKKVPSLPLRSGGVRRGLFPLLFPLMCLSQSFDLSVDYVDALCLWRAWESWHAEYVAGYGNEHFCSAVDDKVADVYVEAFWASVELLVG